MGTYRPNTPKGPDGLTDNQRKFCEEYVKDYNGKQAWLRVNPDCQPSTATTTAMRVLKKPEAIAYIQSIQKWLFESKCVNYERIAMELAEIAFNSKNEGNRIKALGLLQKQLGLDKTVISADINQTVDIKVGIVDDADKPTNK